MASSVLLIYEGDTDDALSSRPKVDVRLIDFDHTEILEDGEEPHDGYDSAGTRWGVRNLIHFFRKLAYALQTHVSTSNLSIAHHKRGPSASDAVFARAPDEPPHVRAYMSFGASSPHPFRKYDSVPNLRAMMGDPIGPTSPRSSREEAVAQRPHSDGEVLDGVTTTSSLPPEAGNVAMEPLLEAGSPESATSSALKSSQNPRERKLDLLCGSPC